MKTKWTQGPWRTRENKKEAPDDCIVMDAEGYSICDCSSGNPMMNLETAEANARLIAAAPEMFALLEEMVNTVEWEEGTERVMSTNNAKLYKLMGGTARALLAKVKA